MRRATPASGAFHQGCFAQLQGWDVPMLYEAWLQETKRKEKVSHQRQNVRPVKQVRILQAARLRKDERVKLRAWTMAKCYSSSAAGLVYHLSCLYILSSTLDKIEEKSQPQFQGDSADRVAIANHDVASSSYSAAFEHVAGLIRRMS